MDFNHSWRTVPLGILSISRMLLGAGSHDSASPTIGSVGVASIAHARASCWYIGLTVVFSHSYPRTALAYLGLGLRAHVERLTPACSVIGCGEMLEGSGSGGVSRSITSSSTGRKARESRWSCHV